MAKWLGRSILLGMGVESGQHHIVLRWCELPIRIGVVCHSVLLPWIEPALLKITKVVSLVLCRFYSEVLEYTCDTWSILHVIW